MTAIKFACISPHPPIIVREVGHGRERALHRPIDALEQLPVAAEGRRKTGTFEWLKLHADLYRREQSQRVRRMLDAGHRKRLAIIGRQFRELTPRYLDDRIGLFQQSLGRFQGRRAKRLAANLFAIE